MTAVTGSMAPRIAVGVEPMICIALVVQTRDMTVGKTASAAAPSEKDHDGDHRDCQTVSQQKH